MDVKARLSKSYSVQVVMLIGSGHRRGAGAEAGLRIRGSQNMVILD
jgi:hypothetical protein